MIAARHPGAARIVRFLLDKGANPNPNGKPVAESSPLLEALTAGDQTIAELLLQRGADAKATAEQGLIMAVTTKCEKVLEQLATQITNQEAYTIALGATAVLGDLKAVRLMLDHGADVNAFDPFGKTALMYAAISDVFPLGMVKLLIERGADVNAKCTHAKGGDAGLTVLDIAKLNGNTPMVDLLVKSGAMASPETPVTLHARHKDTIRSAVQDSLPLLQRADFNFSKNAGCTSCHNNSMAAMAVGLARNTGGADRRTRSRSAQVRVNIEELKPGATNCARAITRSRWETCFRISFWATSWWGSTLRITSPTSIPTRSQCSFSRGRSANGEWPYPHADMRPPLCLDYIAQTALSMRALQLYAPKSGRAKYEKSVRLAASWLAKARSSNNEDRSWRLTGLAWADTDRAATQKALGELLAAQRPDGGWSDLPSMPSTAYATGRSLVALHIGGLPVSDPAYQRGVQLLLSNPTRGWLLVHQDPRAWLPAILRCRVPTRLRSVDVCRRYELGRHGPDAGVARRRPCDRLSPPVTCVQVRVTPQELLGLMPPLAARSRKPTRDQAEVLQSEPTPGPIAETGTAPPRSSAAKSHPIARAAKGRR